MSQTLAALPNTGSLYLKALTTVFRRAGADAQLPVLAVEVRDVRVDPAHLAAYNAVCGFADKVSLPISFPHVMAAGLHLHLLTQKPFPFPLLGLVHVRNVIEQSRPLAAVEPFDLAVRVGAAREVLQGIEFDLLTEAHVGGSPIWQETSTFLHRIASDASRAMRLPRPPASLTEYKALSAAEDIGRRYAKVGRDPNPIHLRPWSAKLFGFKRHIAHGMWSLARCAAMLEPELAAPARRIDVQFKLPLYLPGHATLKFERKDGGLDFALLAPNSDKMHLTGSLS